MVSNTSYNSWEYRYNQGMTWDGSLNGSEMNDELEISKKEEEEINSEGEEGSLDGSEASDELRISEEEEEEESVNSEEEEDSLSRSEVNDEPRTFRQLWREGDDDLDEPSMHERGSFEIPEEEREEGLINSEWEENFLNRREINGESRIFKQIKTQTSAGASLEVSPDSNDPDSVLDRLMGEVEGAIINDRTSFLSTVERVQKFIELTGFELRSNKSILELACRLSYVAFKAIGNMQLDLPFKDLHDDGFLSSSFQDVSLLAAAVKTSIETPNPDFNQKSRLLLTSHMIYFPMSQGNGNNSITKVFLCGKILGIGSYNIAVNVIDLAEGRELVWLCPKQDSKNFYNRWWNELEIHRSLSKKGIKGIVSIELMNPDFFGALFIEKCNGDLTSIKNQALTEEEKIDMVLQIAKAVHHINEEGCVVWDLKPENILWKKEDGKFLAKLSDLGAIRKIGKRVLFGFTVVFLPVDAYFSFTPESEKQVNSWQLGLVILYCFINGLDGEIVLGGKYRTIQKACEAHWLKLRSNIMNVEPSRISYELLEKISEKLNGRSLKKTYNAGVKTHFIDLFVQMRRENKETVLLHIAQKLIQENWSILQVIEALEKVQNGTLIMSPSEISSKITQKFDKRFGVNIKDEDKPKFLAKVQCLDAFLKNNGMQEMIESSLSTRLQLKWGLKELSPSIISAQYYRILKKLVYSASVTSEVDSSFQNSLLRLNFELGRNALRFSVIASQGQQRRGVLLCNRDFTASGLRQFFDLTTCEEVVYLDMNQNSNELLEASLRAFNQLYDENIPGILQIRKIKDTDTDNEGILLEKVNKTLQDQLFEIPQQGLIKDIISQIMITLIEIQHQGYGMMDLRLQDIYSKMDGDKVIVKLFLNVNSTKKITFFSKMPLSQSTPGYWPMEMFMPDSSLNVETVNSWLVGRILLSCVLGTSVFESEQIKKLSGALDTLRCSLENKALGLLYDQSIFVKKNEHTELKNALNNPQEWSIVSKKVVEQNKNYQDLIEIYSQFFKKLENHSDPLVKIGLELMRLDPSERISIEDALSMISGTPLNRGLKQQTKQSASVRITRVPQASAELSLKDMRKNSIEHQSIPAAASSSNIGNEKSIRWEKWNGTLLEHLSKLTQQGLIKDVFFQMMTTVIEIQKQGFGMMDLRLQDIFCEKDGDQLTIKLNLNENNKREIAYFSKREFDVFTPGYWPMEMFMPDFSPNVQKINSWLVGHVLLSCVLGTPLFEIKKVKGLNDSLEFLRYGLEIKRLTPLKNGASINEVEYNKLSEALKDSSTWSEVIVTIVKQNDCYKSLVNYYSKIFKELENHSDPLVKIGLELMRLDPDERISIEEALSKIQKSGSFSDKLTTSAQMMSSEHQGVQAASLPRYHRDSVITRIRQKLPNLNNEIIDWDGFMSKVERVQKLINSFNYDVIVNIEKHLIETKKSIKKDLEGKVFGLVFKLLYGAEMMIRGKSSVHPFSKSLEKYFFYQVKDYIEGRAYHRGWKGDGSDMYPVQMHYFPISYSDKTVDKVILCGKILGQGQFHQAIHVIDLIEGEDLVWLRKKDIDEDIWWKRLKWHRLLSENGHQNIVHIKLIKQHLPDLLLLEKCEGTLSSLIEIIKNNSPLVNEDKMILALQIAQQLEHIHQMGCVHWDIKPENILWKYENGKFVVKLGDLDSISKFEEDRLPITAAYVPCEVWFSSSPETHKQVNSWQLGLIILYIQGVVVDTNRIHNFIRKIDENTEKNFNQYFINLFRKLQSEHNPLIKIAKKLILDRCSIAEALNELTKNLNTFGIFDIPSYTSGDPVVILERLVKGIQGSTIHDSFLSAIYKQKFLSTFERIKKIIVYSNFRITTKRNIFMLACRLSFVGLHAIGKKQMDTQISKCLQDDNIRLVDFQDARRLLVTDELENNDDSLAKQLIRLNDKYFGSRICFPISQGNDNNSIAKVIICGKVLGVGSENVAIHVLDITEGREYVWLCPKKNQKPELWWSSLEMHRSLSNERRRGIVSIELMDPDLYGSLFIEKCDGDLSSIKERDLTEGQKVDLVLQIAEELHHIHKKNYAVVDLKPANILWKEEDGKFLIKLSDLGNLPKIGETVSKGFTQAYLPVKTASLRIHEQINSWQLGLIILSCFIDGLEEKTVLQNRHDFNNLFSKVGIDGKDKFLLYIAKELIQNDGSILQAINLLKQY